MMDDGRGKGRVIGGSADWLPPIESDDVTGGFPEIEVTAGHLPEEAAAAETQSSLLEEAASSPLRPHRAPLHHQHHSSDSTKVRRYFVSRQIDLTSLGFQRLTNSSFAAKC